MELTSTSARPPERENPSPTTSTPRTTPSPHPTTFVQADTATFKQVVQLLTGSSSAATRAGGIPPVKSIPQKRQGFKLYERRNSLKNGLMINTSISPPRKSPDILSPSILDFPALVLSPVTPAIADRATDQEAKAIADKKFYLHPSPRTAPEPPQLLPLFPLTSPRQ